MKYDGTKKPFIHVDYSEYEVATKNKNNKYKLNHAYVFDNLVYIYKGKYPGLKLLLESGSFYSKKEDGKKTLVFKKWKKSRVITVNDIYYKDDVQEENKLRSIILNTSESLDKIKEINSEILESSKNKRVNSITDKTLFYPIKDSDTKIVRDLKEIVNASNITTEDVYAKIKDKSKGYNLIYGLRTRNSINMDIVERWAQVLDMEMEIQLVDRKTKERPFK